MRKSLFMIAASLFFTVAIAQTNEPNVVKFNSDMLDGLETPIYMFNGEPCIFRTSDNGKYAVGVEYETFHSSFMWTRETNTIEWLSPITSDKTTEIVLAYDVADDGTLAGAVVDENKDLHPAIKRPGSDEWIQMPMPELWNTSYNYKNPDYASTARYISPDGRIVGGLVQYAMEDGRLLFYPVIWKLDENDNIEMIEFTDQYIPEPFVSYDMSDDGSVIVGSCATTRGEILPAMFIDGEFRFIDQPVLTECGVNKNGDYVKRNDNGTYTVWDVSGDVDVIAENQDTEIIYYIQWELDEKGFPYENFWTEGVISDIDDDMNIYYAYGDQKGIYYVVENLVSGEKKYLNEIPACGTRGMIVGKGHIIEGPDIDISALYAAMSVSDDATVFAGQCAISSDSGTVGSPALIWFAESPLEGWSSVESIEVLANRVVLDGDVLNINGTFDAAQLYNLEGQKIADIVSGYDISGLAAGLYIVKVQDGNAGYVQKVVK